MFTKHEAETLAQVIVNNTFKTAAEKYMSTHLKPSSQVKIRNGYKTGYFGGVGEKTDAIKLKLQEALSDTFTQENDQNQQIRAWTHDQRLKDVFISELAYELLDSDYNLIMKDPSEVNLYENNSLLNRSRSALTMFDGNNVYIGYTRKLKKEDIKESIQQAVDEVTRRVFSYSDISPIQYAFQAIDGERSNFYILLEEMEPLPHFLDMPRVCAPRLSNVKKPFNTPTTTVRLLHDGLIPIGKKCVDISASKKSNTTDIEATARIGKVGTIEAHAEHHKNNEYLECHFSAQQEISTRTYAPPIHNRHIPHEDITSFEALQGFRRQYGTHFKSEETLQAQAQIRIMFELIEDTNEAGVGVVVATIDDFELRLRGTKSERIMSNKLNAHFSGFDGVAIPALNTINSIATMRAYFTDIETKIQCCVGSPLKVKYTSFKNYLLDHVNTLVLDAAVKTHLCEEINHTFGDVAFQYLRNPPTERTATASGVAAPVSRYNIFPRPPILSDTEASTDEPVKDGVHQDAYSL